MTSLSDSAWQEVASLWAWGKMKREGHEEKKKNQCHVGQWIASRSSHLAVKSVANKKSKRKPCFALAMRELWPFAHTPLRWGFFFLLPHLVVLTSFFFFGSLVFLHEDEDAHASVLWHTWPAREEVRSSAFAISAQLVHSSCKPLVSWTFSLLWEKGGRGGRL